MTRRSFCFLFGAGVAGAMLAMRAPLYQVTGMTAMGETLPRYVRAGVDLGKPGGDITAINLYTSDDVGGKWTLYKTFPASVRVLHLP
jgi:hypothetical protein